MCCKLTCNMFAPHTYILTGASLTLGVPSLSSDVDCGDTIPIAFDNDCSLAIAISVGSVPIMLALLSAGAAHYCIAHTCGHQVTTSNRSECVAIHPLNAGADLSRQNDLGNTPLMKACMGSSCTVELCGHLLRAVCAMHACASMFSHVAQSSCLAAPSRHDTWTVLKHSMEWHHIIIIAWNGIEACQSIHCSIMVHHMANP